MVTYRMIDAACPMPSCLHAGVVGVGACLADEPAYVETVCDIPTGTVRRVLSAIAERYGACGVIAVEDGDVVGKIRAYPQAIVNRVGEPCVQQERTARPLVALDLESVPTREEHPILRLCCIQVAGSHYGRGIAGGMLDALIAWAKASGWQEIRACAARPIPPLLAWSGRLSRAALERRGFVVTGTSISPELREGVVAQRGGFHGEDVRRQWRPFSDLSDDEAASEVEMRLQTAGRQGP